MDMPKKNFDIANAWLDNRIAFWYHMGKGFIRVEVSLPIPALPRRPENPARKRSKDNQTYTATSTDPSAQSRS